MLYTPNFCCHCGESIDRAEPKWTDSSRFCDVCKHDFVPQRVLPLVAAAMLLLVGLFGAGSLFRGSDKPVTVAARPPIRQTPESKNAPLAASVNRPSNVARPLPQTRPTVTESDDSAVCGAMTKKGTPCSRRVKGGGRCWQHRDEPPSAETPK